MEKRLESEGIAGRGIVARVKQTGGAVNDQPELEMLLQVELPGRKPYEVRSTFRRRARC
jgi:hypothetical protein